MEEQRKDGGKNKKMVNRKFMKEQKTRWRSGKQDEGTENKMAGDKRQNGGNLDGGKENMRW